MDLKDILTISGKPGLYKLIANNKNGLIVESLNDEKRIPVFSTDKISALDEISIFTEGDDIPLKEVFIKLYKYLNHQAVEQSVINDNKATKALFKAFFPEYDEDRVYTSHQKKVFQWYNELLKLNLINEDSDKTDSEQLNADNEGSGKDDIENKIDKTGE